MIHLSTNSMKSILALSHTMSGCSDEPELRRATMDWLYSVIPCFGVVLNEYVAPPELPDLS
jgi:hypothetical protein